MRLNDIVNSVSDKYNPVADSIHDGIETAKIIPEKLAIYGGLYTGLDILANYANAPDYAKAIGLTALGIAGAKNTKFVKKQEKKISNGIKKTSRYIGNKLNTSSKNVRTLILAGIIGASSLYYKPELKQGAENISNFFKYIDNIVGTEKAKPNPRSIHFDDAKNLIPYREDFQYNAVNNIKYSDFKFSEGNVGKIQRMMFFKPLGDEVVKKYNIASEEYYKIGMNESAFNPIATGPNIRKLGKWHFGKDLGLYQIVISRGKGEGLVVNDKLTSEGKMDDYIAKHNNQIESASVGEDRLNFILSADAGGRMMYKGEKKWGGPRSQVSNYSTPATRNSIKDIKYFKTINDRWDDVFRFAGIKLKVRGANESTIINLAMEEFYKNNGFKSKKDFEKKQMAYLDNWNFKEYKKLPNIYKK